MNLEERMSGNVGVEIVPIRKNVYKTSKYKAQDEIKSLFAPFFNSVQMHFYNLNNLYSILQNSFSVNIRKIVNIKLKEENN